MNSEKIRERLRPLDFSSTDQPVQEQDYHRYYGLDLENQLPSIHHRFGYIDSGHYRIACHSYQPDAPRGTVFLLHGYYDHSGLFRHVIHYFLAQRYNVLVHDLPGHGLSSGQPASIPDFSIYSLLLADLLRHSHGQLARPWKVFGQSTGCAIITDYLTGLQQQNRPLPFEQVIFSAPLIRPYLWRLGRLQLYLLRPFLQQIPRSFTDNSRDQDFLAFARQDPLAPRIIPVEWVSAMDRWIRRIEAIEKLTIPLSPLILQGTCDTTIDARHNIAVLKRLFHNPQVLYLEGARHHLPNELEATREEYFRWLDAFL